MSAAGALLLFACSGPDRSYRSGQQGGVGAFAGTGGASNTAAGGFANRTGGAGGSVGGGATGSTGSAYGGAFPTGGTLGSAGNIAAGGSLSAQSGGNASGTANLPQGGSGGMLDSLRGGSAGANSLQGGTSNSQKGGSTGSGSGGTLAAAGGAAAGGMAGKASGGTAGKAGTGGTTNGGSGGSGAGTGGSDGCSQQLLKNPGFEQGNSNWTLQSDYPGVSAIVRADDPGLKLEGVAPREGNYLAWLGGIPDNQFESYYVAITQVIHIPAAASSLTLTGYVRIKTEEPDINQTFDRGFIQLEYADDRPDLLWLPAHWTIDQANTDWVRFEAVLMDTSKVIDQDVMLRAQAETDPNLKSSFWLDSLSLVAKCGR